MFLSFLLYSLMHCHPTGKAMDDYYIRMNPVVKFYKMPDGSDCRFMLQWSRGFHYPTFIYSEVKEGMYAGVLSDFFDYRHDNGNETNNYLSFYFEDLQLSVLAMNNMTYQEYGDMKNKDLFMVPQEVILHIYDLNYTHLGSVIIPLEKYNHRPAISYHRNAGGSVFYSSQSYSKLDVTYEDIVDNSTESSVEFVHQLLEEFKEGRTKVKKWQRSPDVTNTFYISYWKPGANTIAKKLDDEQKDKRRMMRLYSTSRSLYCPNGLFYGVDNEVKIVYVNWQSAINESYTQYVSSSTTLIADSLDVTKLNDSVYNIKPGKTGGGKIYLVNIKDNQKVDSAFLGIDPLPFRFEVTNIRSHGPPPAAQTFSYMDRLFVSSPRADCHDYAKDYFLQSYDLEFVRNEEVIAQISIKANNHIPKTFANELLRLMQHGDILWAKNIVLIGKDKSVIRVDKDMLAYVQ